MTSNKFLQTRDCWVLDQVNAPIAQIVVNHGLRVDFNLNDETFHIEFPECRVIAPGSDDFVTIHDVQSIPPVLRLIDLPIRRVNAFKSGDLEIIMDDEMCIYVVASDFFDAWELHSSADKRIVSIPGGQLAMWNPHAK